MSISNKPEANNFTLPLLQQWQIQTFREGVGGGGQPDPEIGGGGSLQKIFFGPKGLILVEKYGGTGPPGPFPGSATGVEPAGRTM